MASNKWLTELRQQTGLTQAALAQQLGITQGQVSRYEENGEIPPRLIKPWARALGVTTDDILPSDDELVDMTPVFDFDDSLYSEDLNLLLQYTDRFPNLEEHSNEFVSPTVAQFRDRVVALKEKPWVVVTGHFDAGKSHLCNFYLGGWLLPTSYRPTTKYPTFVHHVSDRPEWFKEDLWLMGPKFEPEKWYDEQHCTQNRILAGSWDTLEKHATHKGGVKEDPFVDPSSEPWVAGYQGSEEGAVLAFVDAPLLHSCVLVDLPGYDDTQTKATLIDQAGSQASVLLYICRAQGFLDSGDFTRIGHLLRKIPRYEAADENFPVLGNLFIIASHAHPGITTAQLNNEILGRGAQDFYQHFEGNLFEDLKRQTGRPITFEDVKTRFCSFYQETPVRRQELEYVLKHLLKSHMPTIRARDAGREICRFKEEGPALYAKQIGKYEKLLSKRNEAKCLLEKLEEAEPARRKEHDILVERVKHKITSSKDRDLENVRTIFQNETRVKNLEAMIERRYANKKDAQKLAAVYVLEEIQSKTARFRQSLVDDIRDSVEKFLEDYDAHMEKFSNALPGEGLRVPFDVEAVFLGGVAGLGTLGALGAWAATLGNLGGYIIVSKVAAALGISSLTAAGAAGPTAAVALLGGTAVLGLGLAIAAGIAVWRLFAGNWQYRLAKKIREVFDEKRVLPKLENMVGSFWDETLTAFQKGADSLDEAHKKYMEELRTAFGGSQENLRILELRLQRCEELKSFFAAIPWRSDL